MGSIALEEYDLLGDSKYRSYMTAVDRALRGFESTAEWADLIAALTKLNRVLLAHMKYPVVPRRVVISKRLAQCMHPALPSGVHQKLWRPMTSSSSVWGPTGWQRNYSSTPPGSSLYSPMLPSQCGRPS